MSILLASWIQCALATASPYTWRIHFMPMALTVYQYPTDRGGREYYAVSLRQYWVHKRAHFRVRCALLLIITLPPT